MTKITTEINLDSPAHATPILCDGSKGYTKACLNYASIGANYAQYRTITCPYRKVDKTLRPVLTDFDDQRKTAKWDAMINHAAGCSPDEVGDRKCYFWTTKLICPVPACPHD